MNHGEVVGEVRFVHRSSPQELRDFDNGDSKDAEDIEIGVRGGHGLCCENSHDVGLTQATITTVPSSSAAARRPPLGPLPSPYPQTPVTLSTPCSAQTRKQSIPVFTPHKQSINENRSHSNSSSSNSHYNSGGGILSPVLPFGMSALARFAHTQPQPKSLAARSPVSSDDHNSEFTAVMPPTMSSPYATVEGRQQQQQQSPAAPSSRVSSLRTTMQEIRDLISWFKFLDNTDTNENGDMTNMNETDQVVVGDEDLTGAGACHVEGNNRNSKRLSYRHIYRISRRFNSTSNTSTGSPTNHPGSQPGDGASSPQFFFSRNDIEAGVGRDFRATRTQGRGRTPVKKDVEETKAGDRIDAAGTVSTTSGGSGSSASNMNVAIAREEARCECYFTNYSLRFLSDATEYFGVSRRQLRPYLTAQEETNGTCNNAVTIEAGGETPAAAITETPRTETSRTETTRIGSMRSTSSACTNTTAETVSSSSSSSTPGTIAGKLSVRKSISTSTQASSFSVRNAHLSVGTHVDAGCRYVVDRKILQAHNNYLPGIVVSDVPESDVEMYEIEFDLLSLGMSHVRNDITNQQKAAQTQSVDTKRISKAAGLLKYAWMSPSAREEEPSSKGLTNNELCDCCMFGKVREQVHRKDIINIHEDITSNGPLSNSRTAAFTPRATASVGNDEVVPFSAPSSAVEDTVGALNERDRAFSHPLVPPLPVTPSTPKPPLQLSKPAEEPLLLFAVGDYVECRRGYSADWEVAVVTHVSMVPLPSPQGNPNTNSNSKQQQLNALLPPIVETFYCA
jgi:hypothetical protein